MTRWRFELLGLPISAVATPKLLRWMPMRIAQSQVPFAAPLTPGLFALNAAGATLFNASRPPLACNLQWVFGQAVSHIVKPFSPVIRPSSMTQRTPQIRKTDCSGLVLVSGTRPGNVHKHRPP